MKCVALLITLLGLCHGQVGMNTTVMPTGDPITLPPDAVLDKIVIASFNNVDTDGDGLIERYEFNTFVIIADKDSDGCMTLDEYKKFSAGTPEIASRIYKYFDKLQDNCITVDKVSDQFDAMDQDESQTVSPKEFETYYIKLLKSLFSNPGPVGK